MSSLNYNAKPKQRAHSHNLDNDCWQGITNKWSSKQSLYVQEQRNVLNALIPELSSPGHIPNTEPCGYWCNVDNIWMY